MIVVISRWKRPHRKQPPRTETLAAATVTAIRYTNGDQALRVVMLRAGTFIFGASAVFALLPTLARAVSTSALGYGALLGCFGAGAILGALVMQPARDRWSTNTVVTAGSAEASRSAQRRGHVGSVLAHRALQALSPLKDSMSSENPPTFASFILRGESWEGSGMVYLRQGMSGPLVVALQILLNRKLPSGVEPLEVDGHFGRKTFKAVWAFQRAQGLSVDGVVAQQTWPVLTGQSLVSLNAIDIMDPNLLSQAADVRQAGGNPILTGGACNGLDMVLNEIRARGPRGAVVLLRFGGHGAPGRMNVSKGHGMLPLSDGTEIWVDPDQERAAITSVTLMANYGRFASLAPIFASFGCVMMMGCEVAADPEGMPLLEGLANVWGVPVTAGTRSQYWTFEQVGAVRSAYPRGLDLRSWAKSQREATAGMSCA